MRTLCAIALVAFLSGCSAVTGNVGLTPLGGVKASIKVTSPSTEQTLLASDNEVDIVGSLIEVYKLIKDKVNGDDDATS